MVTASLLGTDVTYELDGDAILVSVGGAWTQFARENEAPELEPPAPLGHSLFSFISDPTTAQVYDDLLQRVRERRAPIVFPIRCDAPAIRRYLSITIGPSPDGYSVLSELTRSEQRERISLGYGVADPAGALVRSCGWCKRIQVGHEWLELEDAIARLGLFDHARMPPVSHGMCTACQDRMERILASSALPG